MWHPKSKLKHQKKCLLVSGGSSNDLEQAIGGECRSGEAVVVGAIQNRRKKKYCNHSAIGS
jgi:hypothetical protein